MVSSGGSSDNQQLPQLPQPPGTDTRQPHSEEETTGPADDADDPPADNDDASSYSDAVSDVYASNTMSTGVEEREAAVPVEEAVPCTQGEGVAPAHSNDSIPRGIDDVQWQWSAGCW